MFFKFLDVTQPFFKQKAVTVYSEHLAKHTSAGEIFSAIETDRFFRIPVIRMLEAQSKHQKNTFAYLFTYETHFLNGKLKSCHSMEIPFIFGNIQDAFAKMFINESEATLKLADICLRSWTSFAKTGEPNHEQLPYWQPYETATTNVTDGACKSRSTMSLGLDCCLISDPMPEQRKFWEGIL